MFPSKGIVALLVVLQAVSVVYLWTLSPIGPIAAGRFALFLAVDLLSFSIVVYVYTRRRWGESVERTWLLIGSVGLATLLVLSLYIV
jgi:hypothetical protein